MKIGVTYTNNGVDQTGLTPTINIYDLDDNSLAVNGGSVSEVGEGGYTYNFTAYNAAKAYYWKMDGGASLNNRLRYKRGWTGLAGAIPDNQAGTSGGLPTTDANNRIVGIQGTKNDFDDLNDVSAAQVNSEVDTALNTAIPGSPTADSINERVAAIDNKLPSKDYLSGSADSDGGIDTEAKADINAQVSDVIKTDTISEMSQGVPPASPTIEEVLNYLYRMFRNKTTATGSELALYADDGSTKLTSAVLSKSGSTFTKGEVGTGA